MKHSHCASRHICLLCVSHILGLWQPWTTVKGKYLGQGVNKQTNTTQTVLRKCQRDCLKNLIPSDVGKCRSVIKSINGDRCELVNKRSLDEGVTVEDSLHWQYFDRPSWYLGMFEHRLQL